MFKNLLLPPFQNSNLELALPYLGNISSITKERLNRCISKHLKFCKLKIIFQTGNRFKNYFRSKDRVPETLQSNFVYIFKRRSCTASNYSKTYRHMKVWDSENQSRGNYKHFLPPKNDGKKLNVELGFETQAHMWYFFSANFHLMSLFYRVIIRKIL